MTQETALSVLKTGANVFLTGEPGSGKTHTINKYVEYLHTCGVEPSITASTGIAATHIGGMTIHSWSGIGVRSFLSKYDLDTISSNKRVATRIAKTKVLIIDEISMLSAPTLTMVDSVCREVKGTDEPFGGIQIVFVGDFFQLPPIIKRQSEDQWQSGDMFEMEEKSEAGFAFSSPAWDRANPLICYLSEQHRQEDSEFLDFLTAIRRGEVEESHKDLLRRRYAPSSSGRDVTELYSHNANVDRINSIELSKLDGEEKHFSAVEKGPLPLVAILKKGCLSPDRLILKMGARVMFTKNDHQTFKFVNGTTGIVVGFSPREELPMVKTVSGKIIMAEPMEWSIQDDGKTLAKVTQIPLRLAWAITVHKSQGMSLDNAHMDLSNVFEYGQGYVALSRVRTLQGLTLAGLNDKALRVHPEIAEKDNYFRSASSVAEKKFGEISGEEISKMHNNFIVACGGKSATGGAKKKEVSKFSKSTYAITKDLVQKKMSVEEMAKERKMTIGTILQHLEKLVEYKEADPEKDFLYLKPSKNRLKKIEKAFLTVKAKIDEKDLLDSAGFVKLYPVKALLDDTYSFEEIRVARLFIK